MKVQVFLSMVLIVLGSLLVTMLVKIPGCEDNIKKNQEERVCNIPRVFKICVDGRYYLVHMNGGIVLHNPTNTCTE